MLSFGLVLVSAYECDPAGIGNGANPSQFNSDLSSSLRTGLHTLENITFLGLVCSLDQGLARA
jgi:hypothetical protein